MRDTCWQAFPHELRPADAPDTQLVVPLPMRGVSYTPLPFTLDADGQRRQRLVPPNPTRPERR